MKNVKVYYSAYLTVVIELEEDKRILHKFKGKDALERALSVLALHKGELNPTHICGVKVIDFDHKERIIHLAV